MAAAVATETVFGSHVLTIEGFPKTTAALAVGESIQSDRFLVGGHSWYIECYPRGQDEEDADWVAIFLCLDPDPDHQHHEAEAVKASHKFTLLDHAGEEILSARPRHAQTFSSIDASWGASKLIRRNALVSHLIVRVDGDCCCRIRADITLTVDVKEPPSVPPPPVPEQLHLGDLLLASEVGRDVTFLVGGERFTAHSCVLAARSPSAAFMAEILGTGKESASGSRIVRIDSMEPRVFKALLHFVYTGSVVPDEEAEHGDRIAVARGLLAAADRYGMERLKTVCGDVLCGDVDAATAVDTMKLAHKHGCLNLNQACVKFLRGVLDAFSIDEEAN